MVDSSKDNDQWGIERMRAQEEWLVRLIMDPDLNEQYERLRQQVKQFEIEHGYHYG